MTEILIPNYNGREALELCLESIARHTPEKHAVVVYDDGSTNGGEMDHLIRAKESGLIDDFILSTTHRGHGPALNFLINEWADDDDFVAVLDNDIQILRDGWLTELLALGNDPNVLAVCDSKDTFGYCSRGYRPGMFLFWFGLINMDVYVDGMIVDWARSDADRSSEPWATKFAALYPPEDNPYFQHLLDTQPCYSDFDKNKVIFDPGAAFYAKVEFENERGRLVKPLTPSLRASFRHWGHGQHWLEPENAESPRGRAMRDEIKMELKRLREGT